MNTSATFDYISSMTKGHTYNEYVAQILVSEGISCQVPELEIAQSKSEILRFTLNEKDIILNNGQVLEVKSRNLAFTNDPSSFPFGTILVDTVSGYEAKEVKPMAYVFVSQKTKGIFALPTYTSGDWTIEKKFDNERKHYDSFYVASLDLCRPFATLVNHLRSLDG